MYICLFSFDFFLSACLFTSVLVYLLPACLFVCLPVSTFLFTWICLSLSVSLCQSVSLPLCFLLCPPVCLLFYFYPSVYSQRPTSVRLSLSVCLSVSSQSSASTGGSTRVTLNKGNSRYSFIIFFYTIFLSISPLFFFLFVFCLSRRRQADWMRARLTLFVALQLAIIFSLPLLDRE